MAANSADFFSQGGDIANPFQSSAAPTAAPADMSQQSAVFNQNNAAQNAANQGSPFGTLPSGMTASSTPSAMVEAQRQGYSAATDANGNYQYDAQGNLIMKNSAGGTYDWYAKPHAGNFGSSILPTLGAIAKDPATLAVLAAPLAVTGAGLAVGGGSLAGAGAGGSAIGGGVGAGGVTASGAVAGSPEAAGAFADTGIGALGTQGAATDAASVAAGQAAGTGAGVASGLAAPAAGAAQAAGGSTFGNGLLGTLGKQAIATAAELGVNAIANQNKSDADKALIAKQQQIADEAAAQRDASAQANYDNMAQRMLAYAPFNNLVAQMIGPQNALSQQQAAGLVQNPNAPADPNNVANYAGTDQTKLAEQQDYLHRLRAYQAAEAQRQQTMSAFQTPQANTAPPNAGMPAPLPAQRYF